MVAAPFDARTHLLAALLPRISLSLSLSLSLISLSQRTIHDIINTIMSEDANVGILFFDTENRGQNAEILNNGLTLRRKESYWYGSAWCPHAIPLRSIKINDKFEQAYGFTIVMREMSIEGWSGNVKFGFTNKPVTTNLVTAHISEVQPSCTLEFDSANRRQGKTNPAASWSRYNLRLSHLEAQGDKISGRVSPAINVGDRLGLFFLPGSSELVFLFNDKLESRCSLSWGVPVEEQEFYALVESYGTFSTTHAIKSITHSLTRSLTHVDDGRPSSSRRPGAHLLVLDSRDSSHVPNGSATSNQDDRDTGSRQQQVGGTDRRQSMVRSSSGAAVHDVLVHQCIASRSVSATVLTTERDRNETATSRMTRLPFNDTRLIPCCTIHELNTRTR